MTDPSFFNIVLVWPLVNALMAIYKLLFALHVPYALGFSVILLTVFIRLLFYPLTSSQLRASKKMQQISPHLTRLRDQHKGDAKRLQEETMRLYKEHGVNPLSGCLPVLIQIPLIWALYSVLAQAVQLNPSEILSRMNAIAYTDALKLQQAWSQDFFGIPLGKTPGDLLALMPWSILIPALTGVLQFVQSKMMLSPSSKTDEKQKPYEKNAPKKEPDFASAFQTQSLYVFPVMIAFFSYTFPVGLSLYWNTFTLFGILQQYFVTGKGGFEGIGNPLRRKP